MRRIQWNPCPHHPTRRSFKGNSNYWSRIEIIKRSLPYYLILIRFNLAITHKIVCKFLSKLRFSRSFYYFQSAEVCMVRPSGKEVHLGGQSMRHHLVLAVMKAAAGSHYTKRLRRISLIVVLFPVWSNGLPNELSLSFDHTANSSSSVLCLGLSSIPKCNRHISKSFLLSDLICHSIVSQVGSTSAFVFVPRSKLAEKRWWFLDVKGSR